MKDTQEALQVQLSRFFDLHKSRLNCISSLIISLLQLRTVNLAELSLSLNDAALSTSNYKRLQRFFRSFVFPYDCLSLWIWQRFVEREIPILALDRTNWKLGRTNINILMLSICHRGMAIPLMWKVLGNKRGNSSEEERIELMERFVALIQPDHVVKLVADREFIGHKWLDWLDSHYIHYLIRVRKNQLISDSTKRKPKLQSVFRSPKWRSLRKRKTLMGLEVYIAGKVSVKGEHFLLISNLPIRKKALFYQRRWEIETLFGAFKSRGFRLEQTHLTHPDRMAKLLGVLTLALAWAIIIGSWIIDHEKEIPIKNHKRKARSIFRLGLDRLRGNILTFKYLDEYIQKLSCT